MNHAPADYVNTGHKYEKAQSLEKAREHAQRIRAMLASEAPKDQAEARALVERGRSEARGR